MRERGYDQAELIARAAGAASNLPVLALLERRRRTAAQFDLDRAERAGNVAGAFGLRGLGRPAGERSALPRAPRDPGGAPWLVLVDDVLTTGSTLAECARVLLDAGALAVSAITVARER